MSIISLSMEDELLDEVEKISEKTGIKKRSDIFRLAIRSLISEEKEKERLTGEIEGLLVVAHSEDNEDAVLESKHDFDSIIVTQLHSKLKNGKCLETFVLKGDAKKISQFHDKIRQGGKSEYLRIIVP